MSEGREEGSNPQHDQWDSAYNTTAHVKDLHVAMTYGNSYEWTNRTGSCQLSQGKQIHFMILFGCRKRHQIMMDGDFKSSGSTNIKSALDRGNPESQDGHRRRATKFETRVKITKPSMKKGNLNGNIVMLLIQAFINLIAFGIRVRFAKTAGKAKLSDVFPVPVDIL